MITPDLICKGIEQGVVQFVTDPNMEGGTVCRIGEYWFYFGGLLAEENSPEQFLRSTTAKEAADSIYDTLCDLRLDGNETEYEYYESYLDEHLSPSREEMKTEAIRRMENLEILPTFIRKFSERGEIYVSEPPIGTFSVPSEDELADVKAFEDEYDTLVYCIARRRALCSPRVGAYFFVGRDSDLWQRDMERLETGEAEVSIRLWRDGKVRAAGFDTIWFNRTIAGGIEFCQRGTHERDISPPLLNKTIFNKGGERH